MTRVLLLLLSVVVSAAASHEVHDLIDIRQIRGGISEGESSWVESSEWIVAGPFATSSEREAWDRDFWTSATGALINDSPTFNSIQAALLKNAVQKQFRVANAPSDTIADFFDLLHEERVDLSSPKVAYAVLKITAQRAGTGWLMISSCDGATVWLNGTQVFKDETRHGLHLYGASIPIDLNKDENLVVCRVPRFGAAWGITYRFEANEKNLLHAALTAQDTLEPILLEKQYVPEHKAFSVAPRAVPIGMEYDYTINDAAGSMIVEGRSKVGESVAFPEAAKDGIYSIHLCASGSDFQETVLIGNADAVTGEWRSQLHSIIPSSPSSATADVLLRRYELLMDDNHVPRGRSNRAWERMVVDIAKQMAELATASINDGSEGFLRRGLLLRGFYSSIDGNLQSYRVFVPRNSSTDKRKPVVILLPTTISANRPFIDSAFLKYHIEAERCALYAEKLGMIVVWPGYRSQPRGAPCEISHLDEVLRDLSSRYSIDEKRLYLVGACSGGALAMEAATRWPNRFAAVGLLNPMFGLEYLTEEGITVFASSSEYRRWRARRNAAPLFLDQKNVPALIVHDGGEPTHGPLKVALDFTAAAESSGANVKLERITQGMSQHLDAWREIFRWCAEQSRTDSNLELRMRSYDTQVSAVVASTFVLVRGSQCTSEEKQQMDRNIAQFTARWTKTHFAPCRVVLDSELPEAHELSSNLILVGNDKTNLIWRRLAYKLPVEISETFVRLNGRSFASNNASFYAVVPDPDQPKRTFLLMGSQGAESCGFPDINLTYDGWFGFAVWTGSTPTLTGVGEW